MHHPAHPARRRIVLASAATGGLALAGCGRSGGADDRQLRFASLEQAVDELQQLAGAPQRIASTGWSWGRTLVHCAQSIEYSLTGFPQPRSALFQATAGRLAFAVFDHRGRMTHDLTEPIPGAPAIPADMPEGLALARLRDAIDAFRSHRGALQPHFAYGVLDRAAYARAHAMHLAEHLSQFRAGPALA